MKLADKIRKILDFPEIAKDNGCTRAELILTKELAVDERVRMKCRLNVCGQYNNNLWCPPNVLSLKESTSLLKSYDFAMLIQITEAVPDGNYEEVFHLKKNEFTNMLSVLEKEAFRGGFTLAVGLSAGHCELCASCVAVEGGKQCNNPHQARPSMEALGMNVEQVCRKIDFPAGFIPDEVTLTGMLLID